jgi:hypothetical protein
MCVEDLTWHSDSRPKMASVLAGGGINGFSNKRSQDSYLVTNWRAARCPTILIFMMAPVRVGCWPLCLPMARPARILEAIAEEKRQPVLLSVARHPLGSPQPIRWEREGPA